MKLARFHEGNRGSLDRRVTQRRSKTDEALNCSHFISCFQGVVDLKRHIMLWRILLLPLVLCIFDSPLARADVPPFPIGDGIVTQDLLSFIVSVEVWPSVEPLIRSEVIEMLQSELARAAFSQSGCQKTISFFLGQGASVDLTVSADKATVECDFGKVSARIGPDASIILSTTAWVNVGIPVSAAYELYIDYAIGHTCIDYTELCNGGSVFLSGPVDLSVTVVLSVSSSGALLISLAPTVFRQIRS